MATEKKQLTEDEIKETTNYNIRMFYLNQFVIVLCFWVIIYFGFIAQI